MFIKIILSQLSMIQYIIKIYRQTLYLQFTIYCGTKKLGKLKK